MNSTSCLLEIPTRIAALSPQLLVAPTRKPAEGLEPICGADGRPFVLTDDLKRHYTLIGIAEQENKAARRAHQDLYQGLRGMLQMVGGSIEHLKELSAKDPERLARINAVETVGERAFLAEGFYRAVNGTFYLDLHRQLPPGAPRSYVDVCEGWMVYPGKDQMTVAVVIEASGLSPEQIMEALRGHI